MNFVTENWFVLVALAAVVSAGGYAAYSFFKMSVDKQVKKVREWLLYAVTKAEKKFGSGTGQIKLRYVYDMFVIRFPWLAQVVTFQRFSLLVDEALGKMKTMFESNPAIRELINEISGETEGI